jgi:DNA ligase-1
MSIVLKLFVLGALLPASAWAEAPKLFLLKTYDNDRNVTGWLMSEKLDGVRAYWDGKKLLSRSGNLIHAPLWFTAGFPPFELDGELWTKRSDFENTVSIVTRNEPDDRWNDVRYNVFEVPNTSGGLMSRLKKLQKYLDSYQDTPIRIIEQVLIRDKMHMEQFHEDVRRMGGEGVVVRDPNVPYYTGRDMRALKVKSYLDDECIVAGYIPGKGQLTGKIGALECDWQGHRIRIGSGLNEKTRSQPPEIGQTVTFKYYGLTKYGKPKYPVYLRVWPVK